MLTKDKKRHEPADTNLLLLKSRVVNMVRKLKLCGNGRPAWPGMEVNARLTMRVALHDTPLIKQHQPGTGDAKGR
jgi:hypothetical protein